MYNLGIESKQVVKISRRHGGFLPTTDVVPLKHEYQLGLETLVVHALNRWIFILRHNSNVSAYAKISRLGTTAAKAKLKEIGGSLYKWWSVWFNSTIHV